MKKFCICVMMLCIIGVISGCCNTPQIGSDEQSGETSGKEFELSDPIFKKNFERIRILKDNKFGNEYFIVNYGESIAIYPRMRN